MTFGSVFAGIGGLDLGLERAGMVCKWQIENEPYCLKVLAKHWPDVPRFGDVRDVKGEDLEWVDLICGGFPCQDISNAGKREGIRGKRSGLWAEMCRLVCEVRPRYVLVENVAALLVRGIDVVLGDLAEGGYDADWDCIPAAAVGALHRRDRLFICAHTDDHRCGRKRRQATQSGRERKEVGRRQQFGGDGAHGDVADAQKQSDNAGHGSGGEPGRFTLGRCGSIDGGSWATEPDVGRVVDGVPARVDRLRALGNAVVPQVAEFIGRRIMALETTELPTRKA